jgi:hypothetical protein
LHLELTVFPLAVAFAMHSRVLLTVSAMTRAMLWDVGQGTCIATLDSTGFFHREKKNRGKNR